MTEVYGQDDLRGKNGRRCKVANLRDGTIKDAYIKDFNPETDKVIVRNIDNGRMYEVGACFVKLVAEDD